LNAFYSWFKNSYHFDFTLKIIVAKNALGLGLMAWKMLYSIRFVWCPLAMGGLTGHDPLDKNRQSKARYVWKSVNIRASKHVI
jgi:hypothetical protein